MGIGMEQGIRVLRARDGEENFFDDLLHCQCARWKTVQNTCLYHVLILFAIVIAIWI